MSVKWVMPERKKMRVKSTRAATRIAGCSIVQSRDPDPCIPASRWCSSVLRLLPRSGASSPPDGDGARMAVRGWSASVADPPPPAAYEETDGMFAQATETGRSSATAVRRRPLRATATAATVAACALLLGCVAGSLETLDSPRDWRARAGDDPGWAVPGLDDASWRPAAPDDLADSWIGRAGAAETYWFRARLQPPSDAPVTLPQAAAISLQGSASVYVDGQLVAVLGRGAEGAPAGVATTRMFPLPAGRDGAPPATVTVRYEPAHRGGLNWLSPIFGFRFVHGPFSEVAAAWGERRRQLAAHQTFFVGLFGGQAVLHLLLFLFHRRIRSNLWFSLTSICSASLVALQFERVLSEQAGLLSLYETLWSVLLFATMAALLRFVYELFDEPLAWRFWLLLGIAATAAVATVVRPELDGFVSFWWFHVLVLAESLRVNARAIRASWSGSWILAAGLGLLTLGLIWQWLLIVGVAHPPAEVLPVAYYGVAGLLLSASVYLAYHFSRMANRLRDQLEQVEVLSRLNLEQELAAAELETQRRLLAADNQRKTEELEQARQLQLSLLPATLPRHPDLGIAVAMHTATEVGGDYYDFRAEPDGSLLVAIGDAAGHGARAGSVVSLVKGLFSGFGSEELPSLLASANDRIGALRIRRLNMALALAKIDRDEIRIASAGMPPALVYRSDEDRAEELLLEGLPLGGMRDARYGECRVSWRPGDLLLMLSDGLPEMLDRGGEVVGYEGVRRELERSAREAGSAHQVVGRLGRFTERCCNGDQLRDDVTFVAIRNRAESAADRTAERLSTS
ncbi:MAG: hypothetical protein DWQ30_17250 [Acidobacteria bacterium]|nr:MAG: hypothetical protein DWQ30_17250 [Acidobacteriota bacterium]